MRACVCVSRVRACVRVCARRVRACVHLADTVYRGNFVRTILLPVRGDFVHTSAVSWCV